MSPASVLAYIRMSHFLMLIMIVSWFFSTFYFLPLCAVAGPIGTFGQLTCGKMKKAKVSVAQSIRKQRAKSNSVSMNNNSVSMNSVNKEQDPRQSDTPEDPTYSQGAHLKQRNAEENPNAHLGPGDESDHEMKEDTSMAVPV